MHIQPWKYHDLRLIFSTARAPAMLLYDLMSKYACIALDLEADHAGRTPQVNPSWTETQLKQLCSTLRKHKVKLSVFVVAKEIPKYTKFITILKKSGANFYLHSYSHNLTNPDSEQEISMGVNKFTKYFKFKPIGYKAPEGRMSREGIKILNKYQFEFDASVFPSFWPNIRYFFYPRQIYTDSCGIIEIPHTTISPMRYIFSLSWIKLLGWAWYKKIIAWYGLPNIIVFGFHLHDLWLSPSYNLLPLFWKLIYRRGHKKGMDYFEETLDILTSKGYQFLTMETLKNKYLRGIL